MTIETPCESLSKPIEPLQLKMMGEGMHNFWKPKCSFNDLSALTLKFEDIYLC
jgi:hypothetical protein